MKWIDIIGSIAAICTTISFFPQLIKIIKSKHTKDISFWMYTLLNFGILMWFIYGLFRLDYPVILANGIAFVGTLIILIYKIRYK